MSGNIDAKMVVWKNKLLDLGKRNRLLNYKFTKSNDISLIEPDLGTVYQNLVIEEKTLKFPHVEIRLQDVEAMFDESEEEPVEEQVAVEIPGDIFTGKTARETQQIAKKLKDKAKTAKEEQGINILYTSFGFLEWRESGNSRDVIVSPLILVPVDISSKGINDPYTLSLHDDEIVVNPTLTYKLENDFGLILPEFDSQNDDIMKYLSDVSGLVEKFGWKVTEDVNIALLSFQKINMYKDMEKRAEAISSNSIVRALAGENDVHLFEKDSVRT
jgi:hypothetical protein